LLFTYVQHQLRGNRSRKHLSRRRPEWVTANFPKLSAALSTTGKPPKITSKVYF
jgi:hypothetical protein